MIIPEKISLANIPTPLFEMKFEGKKFLMKRDDFTGLELSGNKVRKLEYLMARAKKVKASMIYTCGGEQSNHSRATAVAARSMGFDVRLFLWGQDRRNPEGNLFIDKFMKCNFEFLNKKDFFRVSSVMEEFKTQKEDKNRKVFIIPEGGSSPLGIWGYINFVQELARQTDIKKLKGILTAAGSGGTSAGLLVGTALKKLDLKIYAVNVLLDAAQLRSRILSLAYQCIEDYQLPCRINEENLIILDGYSSEGYKSISRQKVEVIRDFASASGIILDPAYTGKAFYAFNDIFLKGRNRESVLFVHTGGFLGVFDKRKEYLGV